MTAKIIENPAYRDRVSVFRDRFQAGKLLTYKLREYAGNGNVIVLAVPAGGVPVGYTVAKELAVKNIGYTSISKGQRSKRDETHVLPLIESWAKQKQLDAVIWTNLLPKFDEDFSVESARSCRCS